MSGQTPLPKTLPTHPLRRAKVVHHAHARLAARLIRRATGTPQDTVLAGLCQPDRLTPFTAPMFALPSSVPGTLSYWRVTHGRAPAPLTLPGAGPWLVFQHLEQRSWQRTPGKRYATLRHHRRRTVWYALVTPPAEPAPADAPVTIL